MNPKTAEHFGLVAIGKAGQFTVEVLETGDRSRFLSIETDGWSFLFALGAQDVAAILAHIGGGGESSEMKVGVFFGAPVMLIRDNEFRDRYFLRTFKDGHGLDFVFAADRLVQFTNAMAQALEDLAD